MIDESYQPYCVVCGDQKTFKLIFQVRSSNPHKYDWVVPLPGDDHTRQVLAEVMCKREGDMFLRQFAEILGFPPSATITGGLSWQANFALFSMSRGSIMDGFLCAFIERQLGVEIDWSKELDLKDIRVDIREAAKKCKDNPQRFVDFCDEFSRDDPLLRHFYSFCFDVSLPYFGLWISSRAVHWSLRMLSYDMAEVMFCAYNRYNYQWLVPRSFLELFRAPKLVLRYLMSGGFVGSISGQPLTCVPLDFMIETCANKDLKPSFTHPNPVKLEQEVALLPYHGRTKKNLKKFLFPDEKKAWAHDSAYKLWPTKQLRLTKILVTETNLFRTRRLIQVPRPLGNVFTGQLATAKEAKDIIEWKAFGQTWMNQICNWLKLEANGEVTAGSFNNKRSRVLLVMKRPQRRKPEKLRSKLEHTEKVNDVL